MRSAQSNACALLVSGVTETMQCEHAETPTSVQMAGEEIAAAHPASEVFFRQLRFHFHRLLPAAAGFFFLPQRFQRMPQIEQRFGEIRLLFRGPAIGAGGVFLQVGLLQQDADVVGQLRKRSPSSSSFAPASSAST